MILHCLLPALLVWAAPADLTIKGKECRIKTDLKPKLAKPIAKQIDNYCDHFADFWSGLGFETRSNNTVVIRLFAEHDDFAEFYRRSSPDRDPPVAYFSPSLNGVVSFYDPENPHTRAVLFHETSHQYIYRYMEWAPKWTNEGLAEYFEGWKLGPNGELIRKSPTYFDLLLLQEFLPKKKPEPEAVTGVTRPKGFYLQPRELIEMDRKVFNDFRTEYPNLHGYLHYATSWGLTWYFLEGPHEADRQAYLDYLGRLCEKGERAEPLAIEDWPAFEERWREFILGIEVAPSTADDHFILAGSFRDQWSYPEAIEHYQLTLELEPEKPQVRYWLGTCLKRMGDYEAALPYLEAAAEEDEQDPRPLHQLARIAGRLDRKKEEGDYEKALEYAKAASERARDKNPRHLAFVAECQQLAGDIRGAKKTMKAVLRLVKDADESVQERYQKMLDEM